MPRKKTEFAQEKDLPAGKAGEKYDEVWDIKKITIGVIVLFLLLAGGVFAKKLYFHESLAPESFIPKITFPDVKGVASNPDEITKVTHVKISLPSQGEVQSEIHNIQNQVTHLNLQEIATSSPQVQQVLKQIQDLPKEGGDQVKDACYRLCNNL